MNKKGPSLSRTPEMQTKITPKIRFRKSLAVKTLEQMALEAARRKYPMIPYPVARKFRDDSANGLTKCIIQFLVLSGHQAERISNTGRIVDQRKTYINAMGCPRTIGRIIWIPGTGINGTADISATIQGKSVKIEVKIGSDRQSPAQKEYQKAIEQAGGLYFIARDFQQFFEWYHQQFDNHGRLD